MQRRRGPSEPQIKPGTGFTCRYATGQRSFAERIGNFNLNLARGEKTQSAFSLSAQKTHRRRRVFFISQQPLNRY